MSFVSSGAASICSLRRLLSNTFTPGITSVANSSGRWWPQPDGRRLSSSTSGSLTPHSSDDVSVVKTRYGEVVLRKEDAAPKYAISRGNGKEDAFSLVKHKNGEQLANYVLFEESIQKCKVPWSSYNQLTSEERTIYMAHLRAVEERRLSYKDPVTGYTVMTVSKLLNARKCCGNGCRHCPYEHENAKEEVKRTKIYELSKHRTRPPTMGIHRRTRLEVVDNSALGKEAHASGKLAYCIHVYKQGKRAKHMPKAVLGDKILVAIRGEMHKAYVVGANTHVHYRKHGVPVTDTNNIVLLDAEGNPLGNRIMKPIPATLLNNRDSAQFAKVLALVNKFI